MNNSQIAFPVLIALWILIPLIPSMLIFKYVPDSTAFGEGPFKGIKIRVGGAFAAFFILCLLEMPIIIMEFKIINQSPNDSYLVEAPIKFEDSLGNVLPVNAGIADCLEYQEQE